MSTHLKYLYWSYVKSIGYVFIVMFALIMILNILSEVEFFKNYEVNSYLPIYLAALNSLDLIFEMFPFIFLIATQVFFVNLFTDNQINIFKYSGFKNSKIIKILSSLTLFFGILIITIFYSISSDLKKIYLDHKNKYSKDNKYLAVVTNNGLWIRDMVGNNKMIINASKIEDNDLINVNISEFDEQNKLIRIVTSKKANIKKNEWELFEVTILKNNQIEKVEKKLFFSNFNYEKINNLFSNLSSLSILELVNLKKNYKQINYSTTEIDIHLNRLISYPIYYTLMCILSSIIMFNTISFKSNSLKITLGLFFCVMIYYLNNLFQVLGGTGKIPLLISIWITLIILIIINSLLLLKINEK
jgi:lipopolysaccharide export system permease protein